jgi:hypothetical protein
LLLARQFVQEAASDINIILLHRGRRHPLPGYHRPRSNASPGDLDLVIFRLMFRHCSCLGRAGAGMQADQVNPNWTPTKVPDKTLPISNSL